MKIRFYIYDFIFYFNLFLIFFTFIVFFIFQKPILFLLFIPIFLLTTFWTLVFEFDKPYQEYCVTERYYE